MTLNKCKMPNFQETLKKINLTRKVDKENNEMRKSSFSFKGKKSAYHKFKKQSKIK